MASASLAPLGCSPVGGQGKKGRSSSTVLGSPLMPTRKSIAGGAGRKRPTAPRSATKQQNRWIGSKGVREDKSFTALGGAAEKYGTAITLVTGFVATAVAVIMQFDGITSMISQQSVAMQEQSTAIKEQSAAIKHLEEKQSAAIKEVEEKQSAAIKEVGEKQNAAAVTLGNIETRLSGLESNVNRLADRTDMLDSALLNFKAKE